MARTMGFLIGYMYEDGENFGYERGNWQSPRVFKSRKEALIWFNKYRRKDFYDHINNVTYKSKSINEFPYKLSNDEGKSGNNTIICLIRLEAEI